MKDKKNRDEMTPREQELYVALKRIRKATSINQLRNDYGFETLSRSHLCDILTSMIAKGWAEKPSRGLYKSVA